MATTIPLPIKNLTGSVSAPVRGALSQIAQQVTSLCTELDSPASQMELFRTLELWLNQNIAAIEGSANAPTKKRGAGSGSHPV